MGEGAELDLAKPLGRSLDGRQFQMGVRAGVAVAGEVLSASHHPVILQAAHDGQPQFAHLAGIAADSPVADNRVGGVGVHIQHRRHVHVDADGAELFRRDRRGGIGHLGGVALAEPGAGREDRESVGESGDAPSFLVDGDQQGFALGQLLKAVGQLDDLRRMLQIARKENDSAGLQVAEEIGELRGEGLPGKAQHEKLADLVAYGLADHGRGPSLARQFGLIDQELQKEPGPDAGRALRDIGALPLAPVRARDIEVHPGHPVADELAEE